MSPILRYHLKNPAKPHKPSNKDLNYKHTFKLNPALPRTKSNVIKYEISFIGLSATVVDPKIIFKKALEHSASSIILAHNHPSGNLKPSEEDIKITEKLIRAAGNLDIKILDHLIFGLEAYYSFADEGQI